MVLGRTEPDSDASNGIAAHRSGSWEADPAVRYRRRRARTPMISSGCCEGRVGIRRRRCAGCVVGLHLVEVMSIRGKPRIIIFRHARAYGADLSERHAIG